jgi:hypothetical protein
MFEIFFFDKRIHTDYVNIVLQRSNSYRCVAFKFIRRNGSKNFSIKIYSFIIRKKIKIIFFCQLCYN